MHVVIRADGGPDIGYGHLVRTGALAEELLSRDHDVTYTTTTPQPAREVCPKEVAIVSLPSRSDPDPFLNQLGVVGPDLVFTDAYPIDTEYQHAVRSEVPLVVLQDDARHAICADLFVNVNLYAQSLDYEFVGPEPRTCLGTQYVLLRDEIRQFATAEPLWRDSPQRALVTMGGSDVADITPKVVQAFDGLEIRVDVIVGPGYSDTQEQAIRAAASECTADTRLVRDPDDLPRRMFGADFAVSTASTTTYELLALGTPIVSCPVVDNQCRIARVLRNQNLAIVVNPDDGVPRFKSAIDQYLQDQDFRQQRRITGRDLVDGRGTERITETLEDLFESSNERSH